MEFNRIPTSRLPPPSPTPRANYINLVIVDFQEFCRPDHHHHYHYHYHHRT
ncbi:hypothetical protein L798_10985 [Zootermopsis nevadensis]|uniref:Uncharacterized protein n=1 Tax=Zootermopsis nevadensis TaxID=136037 RepID=A0A067QXF6_ZOONE|nr:hypothetical protein L798_10985 [Zootermopsis nevadensis]